MRMAPSTIRWYWASTPEQDDAVEQAGQEDRRDERVLDPSTAALEPGPAEDDRGEDREEGLLPNDACACDTRATRMMPPSPARAPAMTKTTTRIRSTAIPARKAASRLSPDRYTCVPKRVRLSTNQPIA